MPPTGAPPGSGAPRPPHVLSEKLRPPRRTGLVRDRLERPLQGIDAAGLAFVFAPAGAGKTTLLARAAQISPVPVGWYRMTASDSDERLLAAGLSCALADPVQDAPRGDASSLEELLEAVDQGGRSDGLLVLDDLHEIAGSRAEAALELFIRLRPAGLRVLLGSRRSPAWNLPRLLLDEPVHRVDGDDLRFRYWEVEELFAKVYGEPLGPEDAAALTRRTGGWAAGLQLFHLATAGRGSLARRRAVSQLGGRSGLVRSYLARNVLAELPPARYDFLVLTSTLGVLTGPLCDELLGTSGSIGVLDDLDRAQMFTSSTDDGVTFHYHPVLEAHLHAALVERCGTEGAAAAFARSGQVLERAGHDRGALSAYARAEDWGAVARLLQRPGSDLTISGTAGGEQLLLAGRHAHDPWLTLALARFRCRQGDVHGAVAAYRDAESMLEDRVFRATCQRERAAVAAWLPRASASGTPARWVQRVRAATRRAPTARAEPEQPIFRGKDRTAADVLADGLVAVLQGRLDACSTALRDVERCSDGSAPTIIAARLGLALLHPLHADDDEHLGVLEEVVLEAELAGLPFLSRLAQALLEAHLLHLRSSPVRRSARSDVMAACASSGDAWGSALAELLLGFAEAVAREPEPLCTIVRAAERFRELDAPALAAWADAAQAVVQTVSASGAPLRDVVRSAVAQAGRATYPIAAGPAVPQPSGAPARRLRVRCLGGFACEVDGRPLDWGSTRPRALRVFRLLAVSGGRAVHREHLGEVLWPGLDVEGATRQLHVAMSSLRRVLNDDGLAGCELLVRRGDAYVLSLPPGALDVADLETALSALDAARRASDAPAVVTAARTAVDLYAGDLLPEDGPDEWVQPQRDRLRRAVADAAAVLAADLSRRGDHVRAVASARRSLELDPYADQAWKLLNDLYDRTGDRAAAARCRQDHGRVLAELGVV